MSLQDLAPENTKRALATAINTFKQFLVKEKVTMEFVQASLLADSRGVAFVKLMDRFAMFLAFSNGKGGELRKRNTVMSYYRNVKNWLLERYPNQRGVIEQQLLKMGRILERHCLLRQRGGLVQKAPACTKNDLRSLVDGLYYDAIGETEYQDAALLVVMWYAFGRASDLTFIPKANLSLSADSVLFIRIIRAKTSEEQGLSLFPDKDSFITCPVNSIAMALAMQTFPVSSLLNLALTSPGSEVDSAITPSETPLMDVLLQSGGDNENAESETRIKKSRGPVPLKLQGYVNRVLKGAVAHQENADITADLSSHSFRRGGAQHANGDATLSAQWIFDRGNWSMTATSKAFAYVFNTTNEDKKVSKVLSNWKSDDRPAIPSLSMFDSVTRSNIRQVGRSLFASSTGFEDGSLNLDGHVIDLFTATLIQHFPEVNDRYPTSPYASRVRGILFSLEVEMPDILAWSVQISRSASDAASEPDANPITREMQLINHQNIVIAQLIEDNRQLRSRVVALESHSAAEGELASEQNQEMVITVIPESHEGVPKSSTKGRVRSASKSAAANWFEWYTKSPRVWDVCSDRQYKSQLKQIVGFMKLFLPDGFCLDPTATDYVDCVMKTGMKAEAAMQAFLCTRGIKRKFGSGLLKQLRVLHREGVFKELIDQYHAREAVGKITDPAPDTTKSAF